MYNTLCSHTLKGKQMPKRRGSGEGSIYRRSDGRWVASVDMGWLGGKRRRRVVYGKTRKEVGEKLKDLHAQQQEGTLQDTGKLNVGGYLLDWLEFAKTKRRPTTIEVYTRIVTTHIIPRIGHIRLDRLTEEDIDAMVAAIVAEGHTPTAKQARIILSRAFKDGIRRKKIRRNPVAGTDIPAHEPREAYELSDEEARRLWAACEGERFGIAIQLGLGLGMRRGEITGLKWTDIDQEQQTLTIQRTARRVGRVRGSGPPKNKNAARTLPLIAGLAALLKAHRAAQEEEMELKGIHNHDNLVVVSQAGTMYDTANYLKAFRRILKKAGLPVTIRPHDLRHSTAVILIMHDTDPRTVANILGHASAKFTLDIYARAQRRLTERRDALSGLDDVLRDKDKK